MAWALLAGFLYLYVAVCATDDDAHPSSPASLVHVVTDTLSPPGDGHHGDTDGCGALIHDPGCFVTGDSFAGIKDLLALCALLSVLARAADGKAPDHSSAAVGGAPAPPVRVRGGRAILLSVCIART
ncbi:hypothetical protein FHS29_004860 [Saccharothrix tamanrassetensis]|uniref:Secreted protein n=1 Tax=Saccharothrix tamanrassetensis TaxID=1051531 RepID=A0A841CIB5_9PSEU|nr:hypothetical protein [Saccharothrix tamanrassetensis]MBB5958252.1 hypothetical protein [Saccharothrix tamanrassetensis]